MKNLDTQKTIAFITQTLNYLLVMGQAAKESLSQDTDNKREISACN